MPRNQHSPHPHTRLNTPVELHPVYSITRGTIKNPKRSLNAGEAPRPCSSWTSINYPQSGIMGSLWSLHDEQTVIFLCLGDWHFLYYCALTAHFLFSIRSIFAAESVNVFVHIIRFRINSYWSFFCEINQSEWQRDSRCHHWGVCRALLVFCGHCRIVRMTGLTITLDAAVYVFSSMQHFMTELQATACWGR